MTSYVDAFRPRRTEAYDPDRKTCGSLSRFNRGRRKKPDPLRNGWCQCYYCRKKRDRSRRPRMLKGRRLTYPMTNKFYTLARNLNLSVYKRRQLKPLPPIRLKVFVFWANHHRIADPLPF